MVLSGMFSTLQPMVPDVKRLVDEIVDELVRDERILKMYSLWYEKRFDVQRTYTDQLPEKILLSQQKEFKQIRNMVILEALELHLETPVPVEAVPLPGEDDLPPLPEEPPPEIDWEPPIPDDYEIPPEPQEAPSDYDWIPPPDMYDAPPLPEEPPPLPEDYELPMENALPETTAGEPQSERRSGDPHIRWSKDYKAARYALFAKDGRDPDFAQAFSLFLSEAQNGNALTMHDLGRMFADGLGWEIDAGQAWEWYAKALDAFIAVEIAGSKHKPTRNTASANCLRQN